MKKFPSLAVSCLAVFVAACASGGGGAPQAEATLNPTQGNSVRGTVSFRQDGNDIVVSARLTGLTPGAHGFHIHDKGDCSAADATSAGGHFNPLGKAHGHPEQVDHHAGDMPQLMADASGNASLNASLKGVGIGSGAADIAGRGLIVHAAADDFKTQPTGNSGARVACGVIVVK